VEDHGKIIDEARGEVRRGIENVEVAAGVPSLMMGYNMEDVSQGIDEECVYQPAGMITIRLKEVVAATPCPANLSGRGSPPGTGRSNAWRI
jgi:hypothetical protein